MQVRRQAKHEFTGERFFRFFPALGAERQIVINGFSKGFLDLIDGPSLKGDHIAQTDYLAVEDIRLVVQISLDKLSPNYYDVMHERFDGR